MKKVNNLQIGVKIQAEEQANGLFSIYTDNEYPSMADEVLIAYDVTESELDNLKLEDLY